MVARPETLGHFIFNSDYPIDKVVWLYEDQFTVSTNPNISQTVVIPMQEKFDSNLTIFVKGALTVDNWATSIMIGTTHSGPDSSAYIAMNYYNSGSGAVIQLTPRLQYIAPGATAKYRLWGVVRDDVQQAVDYPKNSAATKSRLIFNTELNYPRLYKDGVAMSGETVEHNLGKIPYVDYWYVSKTSSSVTTRSISWSWQYQPAGYFGSSAATAPSVRATDKTLTFRQIVVNGNEPRDLYYYYRIYA